MVKRFCAKVKRWFEITIVESKGIQLLLLLHKSK
jgi:hypothetical protein